MGMIKDTFVEPKAHGKQGLEHKCKAIKKEKWKIVSIEEGMIPQSGSAIPTAPNFGMTEPGWIIEAQRPDPHEAEGQTQEPSDCAEELPWREEPDPEVDFHYLYG